MALQTLLRNTQCSKGHIHPPWNTTGVLRIAKCESVCGFCEKETKTAANLRKHVAIHIKNEGLKLSIAEGSSGRGRLEMPYAHIVRDSSSSRISSADDDDMELGDSSSTATFKSYRPPSTQGESFSSSAGLNSMVSQPNAHHVSRFYSQPSTPSPQATFAQPHTSYSQSPNQDGYGSASPSLMSHDPFHALRQHNLTTKTAWTVIPASEGARILDHCKSLSATHSSPSPNYSGSSVTQEDNFRVPCYNRETIYDEEWQTHMRDVHGVFLLWPETWMKRIEVLDLEPFGGDIRVCNDLIMES